MNPKHSSPTKARFDTKNKQMVIARAPYNFVPLPNAPLLVALDSLPDHNAETGNTGWIDCTLETKSPLYVRGLQTLYDFKNSGDKAFHELDTATKSRRAEFFSLNSKPLIPGSSLRGMLRGIFEIVTFGKIMNVTNDPLVYRAVADAAESALGRNYREQLAQDKVRVGYMLQENGKWMVRPALNIDADLQFARTKDMPHMAAQLKDCKNAWQVSIQGGLRRDKYGRDWADDIGLGKTHVLLKTGKTVGKDAACNYYIVGLPDDTVAKSELLQVSDDMERHYLEQISKQQKDLLGNKGVLNDGQPVFYVTNDENKLIFFGHTRYFRLPYAHTAYDLVPEDMRDEKTLDMAEAVFGYVKGNTQPMAYASRLRVGDATLHASSPIDWRLPLQPNEQYLTPHILSSPKPTTFQHYLVQDANKKHEPDCQADLAHYDTPSDESTIRGHKLYWHKKEVASGSGLRADAGAAKTQLTGIKPVRSGVKFTFRIYFHNLNHIELGALLWSLDLPAGKCHHLGMAKPLGMGAVRLTPTLHLQDRLGRMKQLFDANGQWFNPALQSPPTIAMLKQGFEQHVEQKLTIANFSRDERIAVLLRLLDWDNAPDVALTRYMEIENNKDYAGVDKLNEYKSRPVLPNVWDVISGIDESRRSQPCQPKPKKEEPVYVAPQPTPEENEKKRLAEEAENERRAKSAEEFVKASPKKRYAEREIVRVKIVKITRDSCECVVVGDEKTKADLSTKEPKNWTAAEDYEFEATIKNISGQGKLILTTRVKR